MAKRGGVHISYQAFCMLCSWQGSHWLGKGAAKSAHAEYRWHKEQLIHKIKESAHFESVLIINSNQRQAAKKAKEGK